MNAPDGATGLLQRPRSSAGDGSSLQFGTVLAVLLVTGWVANHFVALMPTISDRQHLSTATLDAIFAIYAVGLLPGLLIGGRASDAFGRQAVALTGSATAVIGTVAMLLSQQPDVLLAGRLIVGAGVGLAMTSGTAWASDLRGAAGAATAGAVLITGFAIGPLAGGLLAGAGDRGVRALVRAGSGAGRESRWLSRSSRRDVRQRRRLSLDGESAGSRGSFGHPGVELGYAVGAVGVRLGDVGIHHDSRAGAHRARRTYCRGPRGADR